MTTAGPNGFDPDEDGDFRQAIAFWMAVWFCFLGITFIAIMSAYALGIHTAPPA